ncbi:hypothetical protein GH714_010708 [Hevea brasiliensis]|uniref:Uncharacterized protein n=1 Tax=Hevea brasiliensis TaxID=3981 RepID=A0A6A6LX74_HEVBR|nr:hypothetical protein GH714_010708 [Hevea brasiliensis]
MGHSRGNHRRSRRKKNSASGESSSAGSSMLGEHTLKESPFPPSRVKVEEMHKAGSSGRLLSNLNADHNSGIRASNGLCVTCEREKTRENYAIWSVKMQAYLKAFVETGKDPAPLSDNPTLAQIKQHSEECAKKFKALPCIHSAVSNVIFTRILASG